METETPVWKWTAAAVAVIVVCFLLGYFVLGRSAIQQTNSSVQVAEATGDALTGPGTAIAARPSTRGGSGAGGDVVLVTEKTAEIEARRKKAEEEKRKKEEEEKKRREEQKDDADEPNATAASPSPMSAARPDPDDLPDATAPLVEAPGAGDASTAPEPAVESAPPAPVAPRTTNPAPAAVVTTPPTTTARATPPAPSGDDSAAGSGGGSTLYRVRVGTFSNRENAQNLATELIGRGYTASTLPQQIGGKTIYHLQVGAFRDEKRAREIQKELKANGYDSTIAR